MDFSSASQIVKCLDDQWRTPPDVHLRMMTNRVNYQDTAYALERLARAGRIENKHEALMPPHGWAPICVNYYRKLQKYKL